MKQRSPFLATNSLAAALLLLVTGCGFAGKSGAEADVAHLSPKETPIYFADDQIPEQIHSCPAMLHNSGNTPVAFVFDGVTCGCLTAEYRGQDLIKGDSIQVAPGEGGEIVLHTKLAYVEGYYSDSAFFHCADTSARHVAVESKYGVVKRIRIAPGALVFNLEKGQESYTSHATVRFRSVEAQNHHLTVKNLPDAIHWQINQEEHSVKVRLSPTGESCFEDKWSLFFEIDSSETAGPSLSPYGEFSFVVLDDQDKMIAQNALTYNAEAVGR